MSNKILLLRLLGQVRPYWRRFALAVLAMLVFSLSQASIPALLQPLLDGTFVERDERYLFWAPIGLILLFSVRSLANFTSTLGFGWVASRVVLDLRRAMFRRYLQLPCHFFDQNSSGRLISKVTYDANQVTLSANQALISLVRDSLTALGLVAYIIYLDWQMSLLLGLLFPVVALVIAFIARRLRRLNDELQGHYGQLTETLEETIKGQREIKVFGGQDYEAARLDASANRLRLSSMKILVTSAANVPIVEILGALIMALVIYLSASPGQGSLTVGEFMAFLTAFVLLLPAVKNLTKVNAQVQQVLAAAHSVYAAIDQLPEPDEGQQEAEFKGQDLVFEEVSFQHPGQPQPILQGLNLRLVAGTSTALVGQSGSGKSTIASLIPRFYELSGGRILLGGQDIRQLSLAALRRNIAYVSQDVILFNDSVAANIAYGRPEAYSQAQIEAAAEAANALEFIQQMPQGFATVIGENGVRLSGGQRQRLAIARALLKDAPILILDEATSALDNESERQVQQALDGLKGQRTTLIIAHRLSSIEQADNIVVMDAGRIVESGSHADLLRRQGQYSRLLQRHQSEAETEPELEPYAANA
ncbi:MAG: lipid A export permease/ATP-binding protein MsbA [Gammaproteobacteria bacterium SHHR-1]